MQKTREHGRVGWVDAVQEPGIRSLSVQGAVMTFVALGNAAYFEDLRYVHLKESLSSPEN